ncbi:MAG: S8 family serine peptidase [Sediminibacterium sp.]|nr:S8 family serine peptidase [Sediminibacterium sp.]
MKKSLICIVFFLLLFVAKNANAQVFYYSNGKRIFLKSDSTSLYINIEKKDSQPLIIKNIQKIEGILGVENTINNNVIKLRLVIKANKQRLLSSLKEMKSVLHSWECFSLDSLPFIPTGEILVKPKKGSNINTVLTQLNLTNKVSISTKQVYDFNVLNVLDSGALFAIANLIYESKLVDWCHPNFFIPITNNTNDPLYSQQYNLRNTGQLGGIAGIDINIEGAWTITRGNSNIRIAVLDEGVEDHEDLGGRVLNGFSPRDVNGNGRPTATGAHGEATAGIIAATQDNNIGITGIAPQCQIVPINIFIGGETALDLANGINWAWNQGQADVLSNSWTYSTTSQSELNFDAIVQSINNARTLGRNGRGAIVVFSAGNNNGIINDVSFPANVDGVITVGSCSNPAPAGDIWYYSQRGASMDLVAPSGDVNLLGDFSTLDRMGGFGYEPGNYTSRFGGTSAACPQVSGVAALMLSANTNLTETQVRTILQNSATDMGTIGFDNTFGFGRVNACAAISQVVGTLNINGENIICNASNTYSVNNLPLDITVAWSASPVGIVNIATNGNQATLTRTGNGTISLTAIITNPCGANPISIVKQNIVVGVPPANITIASLYGPQYCTNNFGNRFYISPTYTGESFQWGYSSAQNNIPPTVTNQNGSSEESFIFYLGGNYQIFANSMNACGIGSLATLDIYVDDNCNGGFSLFAASPNPTTGDVQIESTDKNTAIKEIHVSDKFGNLKKKIKFNTDTKKSKINIAELPADVYIFRIFNGKTWGSKKVIKN